MKCSFNGDFLGDLSNWSCFFDFLCIAFQSCAAFFFVKRLPKPAGTSPYVEFFPIGSMYGIYANIGGILMVNVTIYGIHGSYGIYIHNIISLSIFIYL